jgi:hypothetical protein
MHIHRRVVNAADISAFRRSQTCVVPARRILRGRLRTYDADVRELLGRSDNQVLQALINTEVFRFLRKGQGPLNLVSRFEDAGASRRDFQAHVLSAFVAETISQKSDRQKDHWQLPVETLCLKTGDCEDVAVFLAALMLNAGIEPARVRVALGSVEVRQGRAPIKSFDHAWTLYQTDAGDWQPLEPMRRPARASAVDDSIEGSYHPDFLFNNEGLWYDKKLTTSGSRDFLATRWKSRRPKFTGDVHRSLLDRSLGRLPECPAWLLTAVQSQFLSVPFIDKKIDLPDFFVTQGYDPRDHFDNGYIDESWARVEQRFKAFSEDPLGQIKQLTYAMHSVADFYSHSSFMCFAKGNNGEVPLYDRRNPMQNMTTPSYGKGSPIDFSDSETISFDSRFLKPWGAAAALWQGKLISGRYALEGAGDARSLFEQAVTLPRELSTAPRFAERYALPHHDEISVDEPVRPKHHHLSDTVYRRQYALRTTAAARHIQRLFQEAWRNRRS